MADPYDDALHQCYQHRQPPEHKQKVPQPSEAGQLKVVDATLRLRIAGWRLPAPHELIHPAVLPQLHDCLHTAILMSLVPTSHIHECCYGHPHWRHYPDSVLPQ